jgi:hypothetical protein
MVKYEVRRFTFTTKANQSVSTDAVLDTLVEAIKVCNELDNQFGSDRVFFEVRATNYSACLREFA